MIRNILLMTSGDRCLAFLRSIIDVPKKKNRFFKFLNPTRNNDRFKDFRTRTNQNPDARGIPMCRRWTGGGPPQKNGGARARFRRGDAASFYRELRCRFLGGAHSENPAATGGRDASRPCAPWLSPGGPRPLTTFLKGQHAGPP